MNSETEYFYETNIYYGVFCDYEDADLIKSALSHNPAYKSLADDDDGSMMIGKQHVFASFNSDDDTSSQYFLFVDEMTFGGDEFDELTDSFHRFEPTEFIKREQKYKNAVEAMTNLYEYVQTHTKNKISDAKSLYIGWCVVNCRWVEELESKITR